MNWLHVIVAAAAAFAISMIFYSLPVMQDQRKAQAVTNAPRREPETGSENLPSAVLTRLVNMFLHSFMLACFYS